MNTPDSLPAALVEVVADLNARSPEGVEWRADASDCFSGNRDAGLSVLAPYAAEKESEYRAAHLRDREVKVRATFWCDYLRTRLVQMAS